MLEEACSSLPEAKLRHKCAAAIEKNADFIVDLILKEVTPKEVCLALGFCFTNTDIVEIVPLQEPTTSLASKKYVCRLCEIVVEKIEEQLNNKTVQQDVENCVKHICYTLPKNVQPECKKFIEAYANEIIRHFPNGSPKEICHKTCACEADDYDSVQADEVGK